MNVNSFTTSNPNTIKVVEKFITDPQYNQYIKQIQSKFLREPYMVNDNISIHFVISQDDVLLSNESCRDLLVRTEVYYEPDGKISPLVMEALGICENDIAKKNAVKLLLTIIHDDIMADSLTPRVDHNRQLINPYTPQELDTVFFTMIASENNFSQFRLALATCCIPTNAELQHLSKSDRWRTPRAAFTFEMLAKPSMPEIDILLKLSESFEQIDEETKNTVCANLARFYQLFSSKYYLVTCDKIKIAQIMYVLRDYYLDLNISENGDPMLQMITEDLLSTAQQFVSNEFLSSTYISTLTGIYTKIIELNEKTTQLIEDLTKNEAAKSSARYFSRLNRLKSSLIRIPTNHQTFLEIESSNNSLFLKLTEHFMKLDKNEYSTTILR